LHKFKTTVRDKTKFDETVKNAAKTLKVEVPAVLEKCRVFEQSLGVLLKFALLHIEALQILDLPEFMQHCNEILNDILSSKSDGKEERPADADKMQDTLVIHYLGSMAVKIEDMDEDRVAELVGEHKIFPLLVEHLTKNYTWYKLDTLDAAAKFFSGLMNSDSYSTDKKPFIPDQDTTTKLVALKGFFIAEMVASYGLRKKDVQKLLDELEKFEKVVGPAKSVPLVIKTKTPVPPPGPPPASAKAEEKKS